MSACRRGCGCSARVRDEGGGRVSAPAIGSGAYALGAHEPPKPEGERLKGALRIARTMAVSFATRRECDENGQGSGGALPLGHFRIVRACKGGATFGGTCEHPAHLRRVWNLLDAHCNLSRAPTVVWRSRRESDAALAFILTVLVSPFHDAR